MRRILIALLALAAILAGCGGRRAAEQAVLAVARDYTQTFYSHDFDRAKTFLSGEALEAANLSYPVLRAVNIKQKLLSMDAQVQELRADRGIVWVTARVETHVPTVETRTDEHKIEYEVARLGDTWKITRVTLVTSTMIDSKPEPLESSPDPHNGGAK